MKEAIKWVEDYEDVEPDRRIVRCKDCRFFAHKFVWEGKSFCMNAKLRSHPELSLIVTDDFYCGLAEKRE